MTVHEAIEIVMQLVEVHYLDPEMTEEEIEKKNLAVEIVHSRLIEWSKQMEGTVTITVTKKLFGRDHDDIEVQAANYVTGFSDTVSEDYGIDTVDWHLEIDSIVVEE